MMTRFVTALLVCVLTVPVLAQWQYLGFEQVTVAATSIGITATVLQPNGANTQPQATVGSCRVETAQIRYRVDGTAPTAAVGTLAEIGDTIALSGADVLRSFRAIRTGAVSAVIDCTVGMR